MRITLDTNFLISSTQWDYSVAHKLLIRMLKGGVELFSSKDILEEFAGILIRDFKYEAEKAEGVVGKLLEFLKLVEPVGRLFVVDDVDDNKVVECAVESKSDFILTYDKHLLVMGEYGGIRIMRPEDFLGVFDSC